MSWQKLSELTFLSFGIKGKKLTTVRGMFHKEKKWLNFSKRALGIKFTWLPPLKAQLAADLRCQPALLGAGYWQPERAYRIDCFNLWLGLCYHLKGLCFISHRVSIEWRQFPSWCLLKVFKGNVLTMATWTKV